LHSGQSGLKAAMQSEIPPAFALEKTELTKTISVSGIVQSTGTHNIYSTQNNPVREIYARVGDRVNAGDILAKLDMSKLENDIAQAELNLLSARNTAAEEARTKGNSVTNAQTSLETSRISLERQEMNTANAEKDLLEAETNMKKPFDSYTYDKTIEDAKINLERRIKELAAAEEEWEKVSAGTFDNYAYKNAILDAETNYNRKQDDLDLAVQNYYNAMSRYYSAPTETQDAAWSNALSAQSSIESAERAVQDAEKAVERAKTEQKRAQDDYNDENRPLTNATDNLTKAQNNLADARRSYERALSDKERAIRDYTENNETKLENAKKTLADSRNQLQSAQNNLASAQNSLNQADSKQATTATSVELQILNLEKLNSQLAEGLILATTDGVVTEVNAKVGAAASGALFVIEDVDRLYVSANVKEYSLNDLQIGQRGYVTTDATGANVYDAVITYISPKAVSAAGSTSVEFEIRAAINGTDNDVRIGMNAFLNVVTDARDNVFSVPLSAIVTNDNGSFIYAFESSEHREIPVTIGLRTSTHAEIYGDSLHEGLQILSRPQDRR
jgi:multidrug efflux pump subunit AcrA (membrane-fusion protein)